MRLRVQPFYIKLGALTLAVTATASAAAVIMDGRLGILTLAVGAILVSWIAWNRRLPVVFHPSPRETVQNMLDMAGIKSGELVYDLGSGDGRLLILAARRYRARGVGVEVDPFLAWAARALVRIAGVGRQVRIIRDDLYRVDLSPADVVFLYLNHAANTRLQPKLARELRPGSRVVSHAHAMPGWTAREVRRSAHTRRDIYLYDATSWTPATS
jgi:SAM-dependent methyltransferase